MILVFRMGGLGIFGGSITSWIKSSVAKLKFYKHLKGCVHEGSVFPFCPFCPIGSRHTQLSTSLSARHSRAVLKFVGKMVPLHPQKDWLGGCSCCPISGAHTPRNVGRGGERDVAICDNADGPGGHCVQWNKPEIHRCHMVSLTTWNLKKYNKWADKQ